MIVSRRIIIVKHDKVQKTKEKKKQKNKAYLLQTLKSSGELNGNGNGNVLTKNNSGITHQP